MINVGPPVQWKRQPPPPLSFDPSFIPQTWVSSMRAASVIPTINIGPPALWFRRPPPASFDPSFIPIQMWITPARVVFGPPALRRRRQPFFFDASPGTDASNGFSTPAPGTDQADWGFLGNEDGEPLLSQPTNWHDFSPLLDVVGCLRYMKPDRVTTIGVRVRFRLERAFAANERIDLNVQLANSDDETDGPPWGYWTQGLVIDSNVSADLAKQWASHIFWFSGFPTQRQFISALVIRRALPWSGDSGGKVNPNLQLFVSEVTFMPRDLSDAPHTVRGFGEDYGDNYGYTS